MNGLCPSFKAAQSWSPAYSVNRKGIKTFETKEKRIREKRLEKRASDSLLLAAVPSGYSNHAEFVAGAINLRPAGLSEDVHSIAVKTSDLKGFKIRLNVDF